MHAGASNHFFSNGSNNDIVFAATSSNSRIVLGNNSNMLPMVEINSTNANINGNMLATHVSTNSMNSTSISLYMDNSAGSNYPNYTMPGTIADAVWASNACSQTGNLTTSNLHALGYLGVGTTVPVFPVQVTIGTTDNVSIFASYDIVAFSDRRIKSDIEPIDGAMGKVKQLTGYTFLRQDQDSEGEKKRQCGLIAQELVEVLPEAVHTHPETGMMTIAYGNVVSLLVNAIKELDARLDSLSPQG